MIGLDRNGVLDRDEPCMDEGVEGMLLRRVHDGEVVRVGDRYLWCSPFGHLRSYCHEPLEILVGLGLLTDTDTGCGSVVRVLTDAGPVSGVSRPVVLTDAGRARLERIAPPDAEVVTGWHLAGGCGHLVALRHDGWVAPCPTCDKPGTASAEVPDPVSAAPGGGSDSAS